MGSLAQDSWMPQPPNDDLHKYKWSSSVTEDRSADATATWGAAFNYKPSQYHLQGDAQCWKKHIERVNSNEAYPSDDPMDRPVRMRNFEHMLATVNKGTVRVYHVTAKKRPRLLVYFPDANAEEELYAVAWVFNADFRKRWWVLAGGKLRKLRVIDVRAKRTVMNLKGHGEAIYDVKVHPRDPSLVLTASKDESLRLWNLRIGATVAIFSGLMGHRGEVVSVDFDRFGHRFASSSIDNSVRIWDITSDARVVNAICASHEAADAKKPFSRVEYVKGPAFVTRQVHKHYVDCVMWVGNALVSKSLNDVTYLWTPGADYASLASISTDFTLLQEYRVTGCDVWFIRFGLDSTRRIIALGGKKVSLFAHFFRDLRAQLRVANHISCARLTGYRPHFRHDADVSSANYGTSFGRLP